MNAKFGDFTIPKNKLKSRKHGRSKRLVVDIVQKWDNGTIPYFIYEQHYTGKYKVVVVVAFNLV